MREMFQVYTPKQYIKLLTNLGYHIFDEIIPKDFLDVPKSKLLFRGSHIAELSPSLSLSKIQGRPEDNSYSGNVLHMTNSYIKAYLYAIDNSSRIFSDKRVGVMASDVENFLNVEYSNLTRLMVRELKASKNL